MLTQKQAEANLEKYGFNELTEGKRKNAFQIFIEQFKDFLVIILIAAAAVSAVLGELESAIVIAVVITINAVLGTVQTIKAENSLAGLKQLSAPHAKVIRDGSLMQIPAREVTVGDEVVIEAGDMIAADGIIISCASLKTDESALTGESLPVEKAAGGVTDSAALGDQNGRVFSGSFVTYGRGSFEVTSVGMQTEVGKIAGLIKNAEEKKTPLQKNLDDFGRKLSVLILIFCGILFAVNVIRGGAIAEAFLFAIALAVAAIPEALSSIVTIVLAFGTQKMAKEHAIIRKLQAVEGLGSVSVICSDKTGTLTQNKMTVENCYTDGVCTEAAKIDLINHAQKELVIFGMLCNDSQIADGKEVGDPTETALVRVGENLGLDTGAIRQEYERISEVPFDSDRKLMSTEHMLDGQYTMIVKGACDVLLDRITAIKENGTIREITQKDRDNIEEANRSFSQNGLRVLAFAFKTFDERRELSYEDEYELVFTGLIAMMDPPRAESADAVSECINAGIRPVMITGDHKVTAAAIAKRIGILKDENEACEGAVLDSMTDEQLKEFVPQISVYARVSPEHKIRIVRAWQERGSIVAMTGDGVNDAPALKQSDIGVAMGITGSEVSKDAAAMVLTDDNFATIIKAVENGRNIYQNIKNAIQFLLSGNFGAILAVLYASLAGLPVPFAPVHLLFINLLTDSLPAIALGLEPHNPGVMKDKPRNADESILTKSYLASIGTEGLCIGAMAMIAFMTGYSGGNAVLASTMAFGTLCMGRLVHGFNCKAKEPVIFTKRFFNNIYLAGAFLLGTALITAVMVIPGLQGVFSVQSLDITQLLIVYGLAFANLPVIQLMKKIRCSTVGKTRI